MKLFLLWSMRDVPLNLHVFPGAFYFQSFSFLWFWGKIEANPTVSALCTLSTGASSLRKRHPFQTAKFKAKSSSQRKRNKKMFFLLPYVEKKVQLSSVAFNLEFHFYYYQSQVLLVFMVMEKIVWTAFCKRLEYCGGWYVLGLIFNFSFLFLKLFII